ncbi:MAG: hypothetical protein R3B48_03300 [Kofleriaceae bacterium]
MRAYLLAVLTALVACGDSASNPSPDAAPDAAECSCEIAPPSVCSDENTLRTYLSPGACMDGNTCEFPAQETPCPYGCEDGECQPRQCTPSCPIEACVDDGCGGTCGPCPSGTTFPGLTATNLGIADDMSVSPDGKHVVGLRALKPLPVDCGFFPRRVGTVDVWTVPESGLATTRTLGTEVPLYSVQFTTNGYLVYLDKQNPCRGSGELWIAKADGSQPRRIHATARGPYVVGDTLFFAVPDPLDPDKSTFDGWVYAARLPNGQPTKLASFRYDSTYVPDPTGNMIWIEYSPRAGDLRIVRLDGTTTQLHSTTQTSSGYPRWSPDGKRLAFTLRDNQSIFAPLYVINADGTGRVLLDDATRANALDALAWSHDSSKLAWLDQPPTFGLDAHIHSFGGGPQVTITGVVAPTLGGDVFRLTFSNDDKRLYAAVNNTTSPGRLMSGSVEQDGAAEPLAPSLQPDGFRFRNSWTEHPNGSTIAIRTGDSSTRVIAFGATTQIIAGVPFEKPQLEPVANRPRWILQHGAQTASIFPTAGDGAGTPLPNFHWNADLSLWAFDSRVPFVFGWAGATALYPSQIRGVYGINSKVTQDLMAVSPTASGRIGALVSHFDMGGGRIYFTTEQNGLFFVPVP